MSNSITRKKAADARQEQIAAKNPQFEPEEGPPRFIADVMLGRLARWLRIAGFDVLYSNSFSDDELIDVSCRERRILLSRDTRLLIRRTVRSFIYIESQDVLEQVRQVFKAVNVGSLDSLLTRCLSCNEALLAIPRESVRQAVPEYVYRTQKSFKSCPTCGRVFWAGTHRASVVRILEDLLASRC